MYIFLLPLNQILQMNSFFLYIFINLDILMGFDVIHYFNYLVLTINFLESEMFKFLLFM